MTYTTSYMLYVEIFLISFVKFINKEMCYQKKHKLCYVRLILIYGQPN